MNEQARLRARQTQQGKKEDAHARAARGLVAPAGGSQDEAVAEAQ